MESMEEPDASGGDFFWVILFLFMVLVGFAVGYGGTVLFVTQEPLGLLLGALGPPLGLLLGLGLAEGASTPVAMMRLITVLDHRHTLDEILAMGGRRSGTMSLALGMVGGPAVLSGALGIATMVFLDQQDQMGLAAGVGVAVGVVYGLIMVGILKMAVDDV